MKYLGNMISYNPKVWFALIFHSYSRHVMRTLMPALAFMAIFTALCCYVLLEILKFHESDFKTTIAMHSLLGIVLGLFLVFRTNSAYDRWWEGRRLWGSLVNNTRNLSIKLNAFLTKSDTENRRWFSAMIVNLVYVVNDHLRGGALLFDLDMDGASLTELKKSNHGPNFIVSLLYQRVNQLYENKAISGDQFLVVDKELKEFTDIYGACERIKNTPIPYSYTMFIKKFIFIYVITLPFAFVTTSGYLTIPVVIIIMYVLLSVELIAEEIEDPFGGDVNDLPMDELATKIKSNVREILGQGSIKQNRENKI
jgi:putative membrane protein